MSFGRHRGSCQSIRIGKHHGYRRCWHRRNRSYRSSAAETETPVHQRARFSNSESMLLAVKLANLPVLAAYSLDFLLESLFGAEPESDFAPESPPEPGGLSAAAAFLYESLR